MRAVRIGIAALAAAALLSACGGGGGGSAELKPEDRMLGDPDAPVTVIEYASITCSHCKNWHDTVWPDFKAQYVDTGKVRFVFRELPTPPTDVSVAGFLVARCAPADRYFNVIDIFFDRQAQLFNAPDRRGELLNIARAAGLSEQEFDSCIRDQSQIDRINDWSKEASTRFHITGTPGFIVNGETMQGEQTLDALAAKVASITGEPAPEPASENNSESEGEAQ